MSCVDIRFRHPVVVHIAKVFVSDEELGNSVSHSLVEDVTQFVYFALALGFPYSSRCLLLRADAQIGVVDPFFHAMVLLRPPSTLRSSFCHPWGCRYGYRLYLSYFLAVVSLRWSVVRRPIQVLFCFLRISGSSAGLFMRIS